MSEIFDRLTKGKNYARIILAGAWSAFAMWFISFIITHVINENAVRYVDTILGFLMGTIVGVIINYYFGSSQGSADKNELIK